LGFQVGAQELPPIIKYTPTTYAAGNQNWMVAQDKNHFVFLQTTKVFLNLMALHGPFILLQTKPLFVPLK